MSKKYYAVAKGKSNVPLILENWTECQKEVIGCKGAIYKSFLTKNDALEFIKIHINHSSNYTDNNIVIESRRKLTNELKQEVYIYVDGSFMAHKGNYSYGLVVVENDKIIYEENGIGYDKDAIALRNVSGEVEGAIKAVEYALKNDIKEIIICFDYQGIESWALGIWKRNNRITQNYNKFMQEKMKEVKIKFKKIKGHSGDKYNDRADILAKEALENI